ncbi:MAG: acetoacetate decarboxylase family protein [Planctomycetaceae bacterium]|nr:acetoacetate decarboxylase family protein [Planctomycetaceae bacterium]
MFQFETNTCYRMPVFFGGYVYQPTEVCYHDVVSMLFAYTTDGDRLSAYLPEGFELLRPELSINFAQCREIEWMAGSAYNLIDVSVPVRFNGRRDRVEGNFSFVVWENKTVPILGGREETGVPKIYADIEDLHILHDKRFTVASFEGNSFLRLEMSVTSPIPDAQLEPLRQASINGLHWRYIPKVGGPGADISQPVLYPQRAETEHAWHGHGVVEWTTLRYEQNPNQARIIQALAELPQIEMSPVTMTKGKVFLNPSMARVLE